MTKFDITFDTPHNMYYEQHFKEMCERYTCKEIDGSDVTIYGIVGQIEQFDCKLIIVLSNSDKICYENTDDCIYTMTISDGKEILLDWKNDVNSKVRPELHVNVFMDAYFKYRDTPDINNI